MRPKNMHSPVNSPKNRPKKLVTRETTKITNKNTERISIHETITTSHENIVSKVTEQFKNRANLAKRVSTTNTTNEIKEIFHNDETEPIHKIVKTFEQIQTVQENKDGKRKKQKKTREKSYQEILSDGSGDDEIQDFNQEKKEVEPSSQLYYQPNGMEKSDASDSSQSFKKAEASINQKQSASIINSTHMSSTINPNYDEMIKNFLKKNKESTKQQIQDKTKILKKMVNDPEFARRNIIRYPSYASQTSNSVADRQS